MLIFRRNSCKNASFKTLTQTRSELLKFKKRKSKLITILARIVIYIPIVFFQLYFLIFRRNACKNASFKTLTQTRSELLKFKKRKSKLITILARIVIYIPIKAHKFTFSMRKFEIFCGHL